jgi:hypothetical protein
MPPAHRRGDMRVRIESSFIFNNEIAEVGDVLEMDAGIAEMKIRSGQVSETDEPVGKAKKKSAAPPKP